MSDIFSLVFEWSDLWWHLVSMQFVQGVATALIVAVLIWAAGRRASASFRYWVFILLLLKLALPPLPGWGLFPWLVSQTKNEQPSQQASSPATPVAVLPLMGVPTEMPSGQSRVEAPSLAESTIPATNHVSWKTLLMVAHAGGCLILLATIVAGRAMLHQRLRRDGRALATGPWYDDLKRIQRQMGAAQSVQLWTSPAIGTPAVVGFFRPTILLPGWALDATRDERESILGHELAHARRFDTLAVWIECLLIALQWWNPLAWFVRRLIRRERERLCDALALQVTRCEPRAYARTLVDAMAHVSLHRRLSLGTELVDDKSWLARRLEAIVSGQATGERRLGFFALMGLVIVTVLLLPGSPILLQHALPAAVADDTPTAANNSTDSVDNAENSQNPSAVTESSENAEKDANPFVGGMVVDESGQPVEGATIVAGLFREDPKSQTFQTDAQGRFTTRFRLHDGPYVAAYQKGLAAASYWVHSYLQEIGKLKLVLRKPAPFVGKVVDSTGRPVPNADVWVEVFSMLGPQEKVEPDRNHVLWTVLAGSEIDPLTKTRTDEQGNFQFDVLPEGAWAMLKVRANGFATMRSMFAAKGRVYYQGTDKQPAVVMLRGEGVIEGRVVTKLQGVSVGGLHVHIQGSHDSNVQPDPYQVTTDDDGRFRFAGLGEGTVNVFLVDHPSDGPWTYRAAADVPIVEGQTSPAEIELIEGYLVEGRVVDPDGNPVAGAYVGIYSPIRPRSGGAIINHVTKADGKYRFHLPPGGTYIYTSGEPKGYTDRAREGMEIPTGKGTLEGPDLVLKPTIGLRGQLIGTDGKPAADVEIVRLRNTEQFFDLAKQPVKVDAEGRFELKRDNPIPFAAGNGLGLRVKHKDGKEVDVEVMPIKNKELRIDLPK